MGTQMQVPDYVFEPEYPLRSLEELRAYVAEEKHLPNVPSEEEFRASGLNLTDFQMRLFEKTEELTLHTLAQDEQIESLQQEIEALRESNQVLSEQFEAAQDANHAMQEILSNLETRLAALEARK